MNISITGTNIISLNDTTIRFMDKIYPQRIFLTIK